MPAHAAMRHDDDDEREPELDILHVCVRSVGATADGTGSAIRSHAGSGGRSRSVTDAGPRPVRKYPPYLHEWRRAGGHAGRACTGRIGLYALIIVLTPPARQLQQAVQFVAF